MMSQYTFHTFAHYAGNEIGHPYVYHCCFQKAVEALGGTCYAYAPLNCGIEDLPPHWIKWFHSLFNRKNRRGFWKDCIKLYTASAPDNAKRIFFLEMFSRRDFLPFAVTALLFSRKNDRWWILFRDDLTIRRKKDRFTIFSLSKLLKWRFRHRLVFLTDSELLSTYYCGKLKRPFHVMPIPHIDFEPRPFQPIVKEKIRCCIPGHPRKEKGEEWVQKLFRIQDPLTSRIELEISGATFFSKVENQLSIQLRKAYLTRDEYLATLFRCDLILLSHTSAYYKWRTSGIFIESIIAGKIPVVQQGTWLASELKKFDLEELIVDWDNPLFFTSLISLLNSSSLYLKLQKMQDQYVTLHSFSSFLETMNRLINHQL